MLIMPRPKEARASLEVSLETTIIMDALISQQIFVEHKYSFGVVPTSGVKKVKKICPRGA